MNKDLTDNQVEQSRSADWMAPGAGGEELKIHSCPTFTATIHCGLRARYDGEVFNIEAVHDFLRGCVQAAGIAVEVRPTHYLYPGGDEPGVLVGLINYPRFPLTSEAILGHALDIAQQMKERFQQERLSVVCSDYTYLLGDL